MTFLEKAKLGLLKRSAFVRDWFGSEQIGEVQTIFRAVEILCMIL